MNERIDRFCENLRVKLTSIDNDMRALKAKIDSKALTAEQDIQSHLDSVKKRIAQDRTKLVAAQADITKWADEREAVTDEKIAEWKAKLEKAGVIVIWNAWGAFQPKELEALTNFVSQGGGLLAVGLGWSWRDYGPRGQPHPASTPGMRIEDYPMNVLFKPFGASWDVQ